jgi:hypothetical protein
MPTKCNGRNDCVYNMYGDKLLCQQNVMGEITVYTICMGINYYANKM